MGLQINPQNPIVVAPSRGGAALYPPVQKPPANSLTNSEAGPPLPKAGFGEGTASQATAAFVTLGRGLESARQLVPTVEDLRAELRARLAETRARRDDAERARDARQAEYEGLESAGETRALDARAARDDATPAREPAENEQPPPAEPVEEPPPNRVVIEPPGSRLNLNA